MRRDFGTGDVEGDSGALRLEVVVVVVVAGRRRAGLVVRVIYRGSHHVSSSCPEQKTCTRRMAVLLETNLMEEAGYSKDPAVADPGDILRGRNPAGQEDLDALHTADSCAEGDETWTIPRGARSLGET